MNKLIFTLIGFMLMSCAETGFDKKSCLKSVREMFPHSDVYQPFTGSNLYFVVIDSSGVYKVTTAGLFTPEVTKVELLHRAVGQTEKIKKQP